jgi:hypothetical protein
MVYVSTNGKLLQPIIQRDCFPSSYFATTLLQDDEAVNYGIGAVLGRNITWF